MTMARCSLPSVAMVAGCGSLCEKCVNDSLVIFIVVHDFFNKLFPTKCFFAKIRISVTLPGFFIIHTLHDGIHFMHEDHTNDAVEPFFFRSLQDLDDKD